uniref:G_PROTEIN_RECEP_F1_2 domain-containing protein n=1 Tax=Ascaris lumbricoides TaxID=6252 RepID=A0A0M3HFT9_ASCLU
MNETNIVPLTRLTADTVEIVFLSVVWLSTYEWPFGTISCKVYQFLSVFTYYSNSNVVVAIGFDRLKVVYTSHIQGECD